jgi:hypothetical protein
LPRDAGGLSGTSKEASVKTAAFLFCFVCALSAQVPALTFTKEFPRSMPPYLSIVLTKTGALVYKEAVNDEQPVKAQMPGSDAAVLFDLAQKLDFFRTPLESGLKVANTGKKTFGYDDGTGKTSQAVFNYSTNVIAQQLLDRFEQIAETERAYIQLERTARFDKLGVNDALAEIESLWLRKQLAAPLQFIPLLNRVANHESYMHLARERAARLRDQFQATGAGPKTAAAGAN